MPMSQRAAVGRIPDRTVYSSCMCNCGSEYHCVFKVHLWDGAVVRVEPDDRYNPGIGREDAVLSSDDLVKNRLQRRPCAKGLVFHKHLYHRDRVLYPLLRRPGTARGQGEYTRISWEDALDLIATRMQQAREQYGPYSVITPFMPNQLAERLFSFWGAGVDSWGWCSIDATRLATHLVAGVPGWELGGYESSSAADLLAHAKLIVLWGMDPTIGSVGPGNQFAWFLKLARERGKRIILFDPRYSTAAQVLADQWMPIKPGTDAAMFMAMAQVLFREDLWDHAFVSRYVEPDGFNEWRRYVTGRADGVEKTPEWAETRCAVPAPTIRELARLVANARPAWLSCHWSVSRKSGGENTVRAFAALQAMLGYWGTPGAGPVFNLGPERPIPFRASWGPPGPYRVPKFYRSHCWAQAVLLLDQVKRGDLPSAEYRRMVGWRADPALVSEFTPKMLFWGGLSPFASDHLVTACESPNDQIRAMHQMEFVVSMNSRITPTARHADLILPALDWMWEEPNIVKAKRGFESLNYCPGVVKPPGEVKPRVWVYVKLAERLGIEPVKYFKYYTSDEHWDEDWERYQRDSYRQVIEYYARRGIGVPGWDEFRAGQFINCDELEAEPFTGFDAQIKQGKPFQTLSGKIELHSPYLADETHRGRGEHRDHLGRLIDNLPGDWGGLTASARYDDAVRGMDDNMVRHYPLLLLTSHSRYRVHSVMWDNTWLREHIYRHRVWIHPADAAVRGIRDGDLIRVFNDRGTIAMPAYVTTRIMPGLVLIRQGGKYLPDAEGVDCGASPSTLLGGDFASPITPGKAATLVQVTACV